MAHSRINCFVVNIQVHTQYILVILVIRLTSTALTYG